MPQTLFEKIWHEHVIVTRDDGNSLLYVDRHLIHDLHFRAFAQLKAAGHSIREPEKLFGVPDHSLPTTAKLLADIPAGEMREAVEVLEQASKEFNFTHFSMTDDRHGIVHVIGPEQGITQPGMTIVCGDSHTATHGAFGALAIGIGTSEVEHVLATQTLPQTRPKSMAITVDGDLPRGVTAKDIILGIIKRIGVGGGVGYVIEYRGSAIEALSMEGRMTVCNMSIEGGARAGLIAPDETTFAYLKGRNYAPSGAEWDEALEYWRTLSTDEGARFDEEVVIDAADLEPFVSWGTNPAQTVGVTDSVPSPEDFSDPLDSDNTVRALEYMDLVAGTPIVDIPIDRVFLGSCTNGRISDLRAAAEIVAGKTVHPDVNAMVVPGSGLVKLQAEEEGLDQIFRAAGFEWREPGCSMCLGMNPDILLPGERCASTSNRNFEGRQGRGGRTHLVSPQMAAAAAIAGHFVDVRSW